MGCFGQKLRLVMGEIGMTFKSLAQRSGISRAALNNITLGNVASPTRENVEKIIGAFSKSEHIYDLSLAHLEDEFPSQGRPLLAICPRDGTPLPEVPVPCYVNRLDPQFEDAIDRIRNAAMNNEPLRLAMFSIANAVSPKKS